MAILFAGGEDIDFGLQVGTMTTITGTLYQRAGYSRHALVPFFNANLGDGLRGFSYGALSAPATSFWFSMQANMPMTFSNGFDAVCFFSADGKPRVSFRPNGSGSIVFGSYSNTGTFTALATSPNATVNENKLGKWDIQVVTGASGMLRCYYNGTLVLSFDGNVPLGSAAAISQFGFQATTNGVNSYFSEFIVATTDTRTMALRTHVANAAGSASGWTGSFSALNDALADGSAFVYANTTGAVATYALTDPPQDLAAVKSVTVSARMARGDSGPTNTALVLRTDNTVVEGGTLPVDTGWGRLNQTWEKNPVTNSVWTIDQITALEAGFVSKP